MNIMNVIKSICFHNVHFVFILAESIATSLTPGLSVAVAMRQIADCVSNGGTCFLR